MKGAGNLGNLMLGNRRERGIAAVSVIWIEGRCDASRRCSHLAVTANLLDQRLQIPLVEPLVALRRVIATPGFKLLQETVGSSGLQAAMPPREGYRLASRVLPAGDSVPRW